MNESIIKINELQFAAATKGLESWIVEKYINEFAIVIPVSKDKIYVNLKGDCFIVNSFQILENLLETQNQRKIDVTWGDEVNFSEIDLNKISDRVNSFLNDLEINCTNVTDKILKKIDKKIRNNVTRKSLFINLYFTIGEYFRYNFKNKIDWKLRFDKDLNKEIPVLFYQEQNLNIFYAKRMYALLDDKLIDIPMEYSMEIIFSEINKNLSN